MKISLEYNTEIDEEDYLYAIHGKSLAFIMGDILEEINSQLKYQTLTKEQLEVYTKLKSDILNLLTEEYHVPLNII